MRVSENVWLIALTTTAVAISGFAGSAIKAQDASAAKVAAKPSASQCRHPLESKTTTSPSAAAPATVSKVAATPVLKSRPVPVVSAGSRTTIRITKKVVVTKVVPSAVARPEVGDIVRFGTYHNASLRWRVLAISKSRAVLLSNQALIAGPYQSDENKSDANVYATSSVRSWLNTTFVPAAFGANAERSAVLARSSATDAIAGDIAYLLTRGQLERYMPEADDRIATGTSWATQNAGVGEIPLASGPVYWWLAPDSGTAPANVAPVVQTNGGVNADRYAAIAGDGIRPAIKIDLSAATLVPASGTKGEYSVRAK